MTPMRYRVTGYHNKLNRWLTAEFATRKEAEAFALANCHHWVTAYKTKGEWTLL